MSNDRRAITVRLDPKLHKKLRFMSVLADKTLTEIAIDGIKAQIKEFHENYVGANNKAEEVDND